MHTYGIYMLGFVVLLAGLAFAASAAGVERGWITVGVTVLLVAGIVLGVLGARRRRRGRNT